MSDILLQTPTHWYTSVGWPARIYIYQFCVDTGGSPGDQPGVIDDRVRWQKRVKEIGAVSITRWSSCWFYN